MTKTPTRDQAGWTPTPYQRRVLELLSRGLSRGDVARVFGVTIDTIKTHIQRLYRRLGATNAAHAVRLGFERGLLVPGPDAVRSPSDDAFPVAEDDLDDEGEV